jgi:Glycosyl transferase family 2
MRSDGAMNASTPTFSVAIAAHNAARSLPDAIESVLTQTTPPLELIVCDDGSTDGTETALARYRAHVTYLRKEHGGVASARNAALAAATGDFFAVLDADDAYAPERLARLQELALARPELDILCTDAVLERGGEVVETFGEGCPFAVDDQRAEILDRCFCIAPAIRRTALVAAGGFDESLRTGEDWECVIRLIHFGAAAGLVDEPLYRYRIQEGSLTAQRVSTLRDRLVLLERASVMFELSSAERAALARSIRRQRAALVLTEAEAALRNRTREARRRAFAAVRTPGVSLAARARALAALIAPETAARALDRRALDGGASRLERSVRRPVGR